MGEENLFKRGKVWYARIKIQGKDHRPSLRTSSLKVARERLKAELEKAEHFRFTGEERVSWKKAVVEWATAGGGGVKESVFERYKVSLRQVGPWLEDLYVDEITTRIIAKLVRERRDAKVTNATIRRDLTAVSSVLRFCCAQGWREDNPAHAYDRSVVQERRDPIVLPAYDDIEAIVSAAPGNFGRMIRFAQYTGMRQEEVGSLERNQIRRGSRVVDLIRTKTDRPRAVTLDERACGTLDGTVPHIKSRWVFWHGEDGDRYVNISSQFAGIMRRAMAKKLVSRRFRFHDLRHWFAVDYLRRGGNIYDLQIELGHSSIKTTELYLAFLTAEEQQQAKYGTGHKKGHSSDGLALPPAAVDTR